MRIRTRRTRRYERLREIEAMDPERDHSRIWYLDMAYEFPWDWQLHGSIAFYYSVALPDIAALLVRTAELTDDTAKRLEDTSILMWETFRHGFDGPRGRAAVRQMNRVHRNAVDAVDDGSGRWRITGDQYRFVLATTMLGTVRGVERHGWRPLSDHERRAAFLHFARMGELMGIRDLPGDADEFARRHDAYLARHLAYSPEAATLWAATQGMLVEVLAGWLPPRLQPLGRRCAVAALPAVLPHDLRVAFGVDAPSRPLDLAVRAALALRRVWVRCSPPRTEPAIPDVLPTEQYPDGDYDLSRIGPAHSTGPACPVHAVPDRR